MGKNLVLSACVGLFLGWIFSRLFVYVLASNGIKTDWVVQHHSAIQAATGLLFGVGAVLCTLLSKKTS